MKRPSSLAAALALAFAAAGVEAAPAKRKAAAKSSGPAPMASASEIEKLKGSYKWGMSPDEVMTKVVERVEATYEERLKKTVNDPTKQDRVRKEMRAEVEQVRKTALVKFEGGKSGYDVSIIGHEFAHGNGESMLVAREEGSSRYFFFHNDRLYKMFISFDKEMLQGKEFPEFGAMMQAKFGKAREVIVEEKSKDGVQQKLDHYVWGSKTGDGLRLVDRSGFYDVFCLVVYDNGVEERLAEVRKNKQKVDRVDPLVEAVAATGAPERDANDNVVDRVVGRKVVRPGDEVDQGNIKVPSPAQPVRAPTPEEVNAPSGDDGEAAKSKGKAKPAKPAKDVEL